MGREKGGPGRSKSRPSSSSLAAAHPGAAPLGFGGYVGSSLVETTFSAEREVSQDLDGEAALQLKRLSKRDPTTKLKALAALREIFKEHSVDELAAILLTWVFEYKRLVQDNNRHVRENTHGAMADLTTNAGRGLARHLRSLMGAWWVSQFDPSREVAEAAQRSFQVTFPDRKKRVDAVDLLFERHDDLSGREFEADSSDVNRNGYFARRGYRETRKSEFQKSAFSGNNTFLNQSLSFHGPWICKVIHYLEHNSC